MDLQNFAFHDIHVPRAPHARFVGTTSMGPRCDAIVQMDWVAGQIVSTLKKLDIEKETMIIFTSDNGPVLNDGYEDPAVEKLGDHKPGGHFRGGKYSAYEAGTRVPTIISWPGKIKPQESDALWSQIDIYASLASLLGIDAPEINDTDSQNMINTMLGKSEKGRRIMLEESFTLSLRFGDWKYIRPTENDYSWIDEVKKLNQGSKKRHNCITYEMTPESKPT